MVKIKCDNCKREVEISKDWDINSTCKECGGSFSEIGKEQEEQEEEEYANECEWCGSEKDLIWFTEPEYHVCKNCIDKDYPREKEIIEKPIILDNNSEKKKAINFSKKTKFD